MPFQAAAEHIVNSAHGTDATYAPPDGEAVPLRVIIGSDSGLFPGSFKGPTNSYRIQATFLTSSGVEPVRGGTITTADQTYKVEGRPEHNNYLTTVTVKHG
jgi:hypothetical protein